MDEYISLLTQTRNEAAVEMFSLSLIAAIIGYVTAWLFSKTINAKRIKDAESERDAMKVHLVNLNKDNHYLQENLRDKENQMLNLIAAIKTLKPTRVDAVNEKDRSVAQAKKHVRYKGKRPEYSQQIRERRAFVKTE